MKATVIIGAGASAPFGVPTLRGLFKDSRARKHLENDSFLRSHLETHFWEPRGVNIESSPNSLTVEEILTILRDSENDDYRSSPILGDDIGRFRKSLYLMIKKAVFDGKSSTARALNPIIEYANENWDEITWASFNWDCIFESSFYYQSGTDWTHRTNPQVMVDLLGWDKVESKHKFLKLHGGVNWWFSNSRIRYLSFSHNRNTLSDYWNRYESDESNCGHPVILEPSYYKYEDPIYDLLKGQWEYFSESLMKSDLVILVGYSLPDADAKARTALMLGFQANQNSKWVVVDKDESICNKYNRLFGSRRLATFSNGLSDFNADFRGNIQRSLF